MLLADEEHSDRSEPVEGAAWSVALGSPEWKQAERACHGYLRKHWNARSDHEDLVWNAVVEASRTFQARNNAQFSTLAVTIVSHMVLRGDRLPIAAAVERAAPGVAAVACEGRPEDDGLRVPRGSIAALGRALDQLFRHEKMMVEALMFRARDDLAAHFRQSLGPGGLFEHCLRCEGLHPWRVNFETGFDADVRSYADRVLRLKEVTLADGTKVSHWVESRETMDVPLRIVGRRADRYSQRHDRRLSTGLRAAFGKMRIRHAALVFKDMRTEAALSILRYAMKLAGIGGTTVHRALNGLRAARALEERQQEAGMLRASADARDEERREKTKA